MEAQLEPLQNEATSGVGKTLIVPEPERIVRFLIRGKGPPMGGEITFECCPMDTGNKGIVWRAMKTVPVPTDIGVVTEYYAGEVSGMMFRARISTPVMGGTITVWPLVGVLIGNANKALEPVVRYLAEYTMPGEVTGMFRARISTPVTGGTVTVLGVRPEEQKGWSRRQS